MQMMDLHKKMTWSLWKRPSCILRTPVWIRLRSTIRSSRRRFTASCRSASHCTNNSYLVIQSLVRFMQNSIERNSTARPATSCVAFSSTTCRATSACNSRYAASGNWPARKRATPTRQAFTWVSILFLVDLYWVSRVHSCSSLCKWYLKDRLHLYSSSAVDLYASKQMRDCIARLVDYLWKTPGLPQTSHLAESRKISLEK